MKANLRKYVTTIPNSGFRVGHKLDDLITGFILAEWYGLEYLHSPIPNQDWEPFFGFGDNENLFSDFLDKKIPIISCSPVLGVKRFNSGVRAWLKFVEQVEYRFRRLQKRTPFKPIQKWRRPYWDGVSFESIEKIFANRDSSEEVIYCTQKGFRVMLYQVHQWGKEGKINPQIYRNVIEKLREKYHNKQHPEKECYFEPNLLNIAVHVRRDDASVENQRYLSLEFYQAIVQQLAEVLREDAHEFHIYSSGCDEDMDEIVSTFEVLSNRVKFHLNESAMEAVHHMAVADVLVGSHSSFSDWAGFLSRNIKLYHPHFHMFNLDESEWIVLDNDGNFDHDTLRRMLKIRVFGRSALTRESLYKAI